MAITVASVRTFGGAPVQRDRETGRLFVSRRLVDAKLLHDDIRRIVGGRFFGVTFIKRTNGDPRKMNARLGVTKHLKGGDRGYEARSKDLLGVYDIQTEGYRSINLRSMREFRYAGEVIEFR